VWLPCFANANGDHPSAPLFTSMFVVEEEDVLLEDGQVD
tara:strand:- start:209 stop:325 length:117 start_codon:yes stop_codon:yes gene_type:complete